MFKRQCIPLFHSIIWEMQLPVPSRHLLVQSQQWKHQKNVWNLFKVKIEDTKRCQWPRFGVIIVNFEYISHIVLVIQIVTLNR